MPPGNDALAQIFTAFFDRVAIPAIATDLSLLRTVMEDINTTASEPTLVTYQEVTAGSRPALWHIPVSAQESKNVILYFHGGGFVTNGLNSHRKMVGHVAKRANCKALAVDYRLSPEARFPSQIEDAVEAYQWLLQQGYKAENIATAGDSAGGNLATSLVLKLRDLNHPLPAAIIGLSPWYDMELLATGTLSSNASTDAFVQAPVLENMRSLFLPDGAPEILFTDPLVNPLHADVTGLPPMYLAAGGYETLLDDSTKMAEKIKEAGGNVVLDVKEGMQHVYPYMAGKHEMADETLESIGVWVNKQFAT
ncbi:hypothetical protein EG328_003052 [Venturia inaequalis]|uniref:Alpha/beta hydrolase fold-3 domain-containing protein n=1 Tax=Venturia inaequalis TaxID=5025 RepID=A0A8H3VGN6_VENIN|nr:hypothetical protein EG327_005418 [Venturia inaequalis]KAE9987328.1 hypothetical protein EG328_003052 [Venturia inaequalis]